VATAAFFDLDRTLIASSSSLALAGPFHERGLISRRQLVKARIAQALFTRLGASHGRAGQTADAAMTILKGLPVEALHEIVADAWDTVLRPLVLREPLELARAHASQGERVLVVSGALLEVGERVANELGFDGALGSVAETAGGRYTGRLERRLLGQAKADALRELARGGEIDLVASTAYSDSHSDLPFLEAVGAPVVVNPDRELRRVAAQRGWPVRSFTARAFPR
jgi:HAD superfamily hydrolase (TIGR01490 family)